MPRFILSFLLSHLLMSYVPPTEMVKTPTQTVRIPATAIPTRTPVPTKDTGAPEIVTIEDVDHIPSTATFYPAASPPPWSGIILLHMSGGDRHIGEENGLAKLLVENGYAVLAVDIRSHGGSGGDPSWENAFSDVRRWWNYLAKREEINPNKTALIGGSIGANLALITGAAKPEVRTVVLLSPGHTYNSAPFFETVSEYGQRPMLLVASHDDVFPAVADIEQMAEFAQGDTEVVIYEDAGHGTEMLATKPELSEIIIAWLNRTVK